MKTLQESIINERINSREYKDIREYVKSLITKCLTYGDYLDVISAIRNGLEEGLADNKKYYKPDYKDGKPLEETKEFESDIYDIILDLRKVATNNGNRK